MGKRDPEVDAYIRNAPEFAKPILAHIRSVVHEACPAVVEGTKWSVPHFDYHGIMCGMAAFKQHCTFGFWKSGLVLGADAKPQDSGAGQFGRLRKVSDLPSKKILTGYIHKAMKLNEKGTRVERPKKSKKPEVEVPAYMRTALGRNTKAKTAFDAFSPSHRREYVEWITEAKTEATRDKRLEQAIEWIAEGKSRNWKYKR
jgi:uncharacterized protein YdeI (YjbR/CyaY-like superfamily)